MGFFRLLQGQHQEPGRRNFAVTTQRDAKGAVIAVNQPIVQSDQNLVKLFGKGKFEAVSDPNESLLHVTAGGGRATTPTPTPSPVQQAATRGAVGISEPPNYGKDVTKRFPAAAQNGVAVFMKPGGKYTLVDVESEPEVIITADGPIAKSEVSDAIDKYLDS